MPLLAAGSLVSKSRSCIPVPSTACSRRWCSVVDNGFVRVEIGLDGGQILSILVTPASADALEASLTAGALGAIGLEAQDGNILLVLARVLYPKRFATQTPV